MFQAPGCYRKLEGRIKVGERDEQFKTMQLSHTTGSAWVTLFRHGHIPALHSKPATQGINNSLMAASLTRLAAHYEWSSGGI